jgi:hypothetical protein
LGQTKGYVSGTCCFSAKHTTLRRKSKDWLALNQDNESEWGDMSIRGNIENEHVEQELILWKFDALIGVS